MDSKNNSQQPLQGNSGEQDLTKNTTLNDPGAAVADYGRSGTGLDNSEQDQQENTTGEETRSGDNSTIGTP